jgi:hypothetical protein
MDIKTFTELSRIESFKERYHYLRLDGRVGEDTFGFDRYLNQVFYKSPEWKRVRDFVILRDNGCDLGVPGYEIYGKILIHHMNPITIEDIRHGNESILDPEFLICVSHNTHNAIHYGDEDLLITEPIVRTKNDTCPWRL